MPGNREVDATLARWRNTEWLTPSPSREDVGVAL
jgi:hypothetical protein